MATEISPAQWLSVTGCWGPPHLESVAHVLLPIASIRSLETTSAGNVRIRFNDRGADFIAEGRDFEWFEAFFTKARVWPYEERGTDGK